MRMCFRKQNNALEWHCRVREHNTNNNEEHFQRLVLKLVILFGIEYNCIISFNSMPVIPKSADLRSTQTTKSSRGWCLHVAR